MDSPWFLRFTALFLAVILFFSVQAEEGNQNGKTVGNQLDTIRELPVEVYYDDENLVVTGIPETVNVTIEGPINIVQTTKLLKDFTLFVDLRTLTMGEHQVRIQHENISDKLKVKLDPSTIDVLIEERITKTLRVDPEFNHQLLAENFNVVNMEVKPSTIEVTGAKSVVEAISFVKATASNDEGINKSFDQQAKVRVLDKDLNKLNVTVVPENVTIKIEVAENSKEVPIVLKAEGTPPANVDVDTLTTETKAVTLFGPSNVLDDITELNVSVDVSKIKGKGTLDVDVKKPKGVSSISISKVKVNINATTTDADSEEEAASNDDSAKDSENDEVVSEDVPLEQEKPLETVKFENFQVAVIGLDRKFKSTLIKPANGLLTLTVTARSDVINTLKISDFAGSVDASEIDAEGEIVLPVLMKSPPNVNWVLSDEEVTLKIEFA